MKYYSKLIIHRHTCIYQKATLDCIFKNYIILLESFIVSKYMQYLWLYKKTFFLLIFLYICKRFWYWYPDISIMWLLRLLPARGAFCQLITQSQWTRLQWMSDCVPNTSKKKFIMYSHFPDIVVLGFATQHILFLRNNETWEWSALILNSF